MWPSRPEKLLMLGLLIWGLLLFWATHYIGDIAQVRRSATIYQLDEIVSFVSEPCCLIVFLQPWMYPTFYGLYYLFVIFAPAIFAFAFGKGVVPLVPPTGLHNDVHLHISAGYGLDVLGIRLAFGVSRHHRRASSKNANRATRRRCGRRSTQAILNHLAELG